MKVLVTNDDGIDSPGLHALAGAVIEVGWTPVVAAPASDFSAASAALGPLDEPNRVSINQVDLPGLAGFEAHSVGAPPAFIVLLGDLGVFGEPVELVLAGVNRGSNTGTGTLYSATLGAVLTGRQLGLSGLALSQVDDHQNGPQHWSSATEIAKPLITWLATTTEPIALNVNVPNLPLDEILGIRQAELGPTGEVQTEIVDRDDQGIEFNLVPVSAEPPANSDIALLKSDHATVSAVTGPTIVGDLALPVSEWWNSNG